MNGQRRGENRDRETGGGWAASLRPSRVIGPLPPRVVSYTWELLLDQGLELGRLSAYALTAGGRTVYLLGPHREGGPRGLSLRGGRVSLDGADERGGRVQLRHLIPASVDVYLCVSGP